MGGLGGVLVFVHGWPQLSQEMCFHCQYSRDNGQRELI